MAGESQAVPKSDPDPTVITTEIINKEIRHLRELLEAKIQNEHDLCVEQFRGVDRQLQQGELSRIEQKNDNNQRVDAALAAQKEAVKEQTSSSDRAIAKSEDGTAKEIAQMSATFGAAVVGLSDKLENNKEQLANLSTALMPRTEWDVGHKAIEDKVAAIETRLTKMESVKQGGVEERTEHRAGISANQAMVGFVIMLLLAIVPLVALMVDIAGSP